MAVPVAFLAAAAFLAGTALAGPLSAPGGALAGLVALGVALRRRAGLLVAAAAAGTLVAGAQGGVAPRPPAWVDLSRPLEAQVRVRGHWLGWEDGWSAPAELRWLAQDGHVAATRLPLYLEVRGEAAPPDGTRLVVTGHLRRRAGAANRRPAAAGPWRLAVPGSRLMTEVVSAGPAARIARRLRGAAEAVVERAAPDAGAGRALARALLLGDRSELPKSWLQGLRRTGLAHLLAISGLHVVLVAGFGWGVGVAAGSRRLGLGLALAAVGAYLAVVGPRPSILRASLMALLAGAALLLRRLPQALAALGGAAVLLVLDRPELVRDLGFQLSFAATAGILLLAPRFEAAWGRGVAARPLAATVAAQLAAWPWALPAFHLLCPWSPLLNLVAIPWTAVVLLLALVWLAVAAVAPVAGAALAPLLDLAAAPYGWTARPAPSPWWVVPVAVSPLGAAALAALAAAVALRPRRFAVLAAIGLAVGLCDPARQGPPPLAIAFLDVGQGDAILLRDGDRTLLFDGGGRPREDTGGWVLLPALLGEGVARLEAVALSHPHHDHCGGLVDVASYLPVGEVWLSPGWEPSPCLETLTALPRAGPVWLQQGREARLGRWRLEVLYPPPAGAPGSLNDRSLVLRASAAGRSFLLTGDIEGAAEADLVLARREALAADVLKVPHHGSRTSSGRPFLAAVAPRLAVVSAGRRNAYGHPAEVTLERLRAAGVRLLRTDRDGAVHLTLGAGGRWRVETPGAAPRGRLD